ncbi:hypothetical protein CVT26_010292 [Gymnopilus dilepis]|uniref:N-acetyltransferase domain-containing protein n=1 Tax=Gymnopilus dilepis TaxID=231916 RepID=A0A409Y0Y5_9AGAR|nr:hypothetical protein CVT26_010292 [Gymnopilus dilepis]
MEPLLNTLENTRIRAFRDTDARSVHEVYMEAMLHASNSPAHVALNRQLLRRPSLAMYAAFTAGLLLASRPGTRIPGILLSAGVASIFLSWRRYLWTRFRNFYQSALQQDLADIGRHYTPEPSAFWVAEIERGKDAGKIIGCVGLDASTTPDPSTVEIRRMVVSPKYQRHGVGSRLLNTAIDHTRAHGLSRINLSTSMYQEPAIRLYESFGFVEERKVEVVVKFLFIVSKASLNFYSLVL